MSAQTAEKIASGFKEGANAAMDKVRPPRLSNYRVAGKWFADKGYQSLFVLTPDGGGTETFEVDGEEVVVNVTWYMKGNSLILTCHADRDYEHWVNPGTYERGGLQGESADGDTFRFYPLR